MDLVETSQFYYLLYSALLENCPVRSGHMVRNITLEDFSDRWVITISAINDNDYDYARAVNYALAARWRMQQQGFSDSDALDNVLAASQMTYQEIRDSRPRLDRKSGSLGISAKEAKNYMWVERTIRQAAEAYGGTVKYELY